MKSLTRISVLTAALWVSACAPYQRSVMEPWLGASESELVQAWGYPSSSTDITQATPDTKVYTYRYTNSDPMTGAPTPCRLSFTLQQERVSRWDLSGGACPRVERPGRQ